MVCLGNICRSPLAEGILQQKVKGAGLDWKVDSAGTGNYHTGEAPHHSSQKVAKLNGIDISLQKCRQFLAEDMLRFDKIYVMDSDNYNEVKRISGKLWDEKKTALLMNEQYPGQNMNVPDPWYGTEKDFHLVFDMLDKVCAAVIKKYSTQHG